ncbi:MAG: diaminopimelate decarboxylase [Verrucomicrobiota bacterium]|nr:diaminopimelate decarboxylase [Verrucomicrobiota bacterium]
MHDFDYQNGKLFCEGVALNELASTYGTPLYVYSQNTIKDNFNRLSSALSDLDHHIAFAVKSNSNLSILKLLKNIGADFDIVSGGELFRVLKAGGTADQCTFAGVGKTREEIEYSLEQGIYSFNVESEAELRFINEIAKERDSIAPVAVRVNPNVDAKTHKYISTGKSENKFGIDFEFIEDLYSKASSEFKNIKLRGLQMHIGSQLTQVKPFLEAVEKVSPLVTNLKNTYGIEFFSIGGGIGIVYEEALASGKKEWWDEKDPGNKPLTVEEYAEKLVPILSPLKIKILLEPGRFMVGNAGALITKVLYKKIGTAKNFAIVDAGMGDLIRPALYQGHHEIVPLNNESEQTQVVDIVGPICESGDFFAQNRELPLLQEGDHIALLSAGAYGFVMASNYNSRAFPAEIMVLGNTHQVVRKRQNYEDLIMGETL